MNHVGAWIYIPWPLYAFIHQESRVYITWTNEKKLNFYRLKRPVKTPNCGLNKTKRDEEKIDRALWDALMSKIISYPIYLVMFPCLLFVGIFFFPLKQPQDSGTTSFEQTPEPRKNTQASSPVRDSHCTNGAHMSGQ